MREDTVRLWRGDFMRNGVAALPPTVAPGPGRGEERGGLACGRVVAGGAQLQGGPLSVADNPVTSRNGRKRACP